MKTLTLILFLALTFLPTNKSYGCECETRNLKTELTLTKEVIVGKVLQLTKETYTIYVLKSWKGLVKSDTIFVEHGLDGCHRPNLPPSDEYFLIYLDQVGISICSRTINYWKTKDTQTLDSLFKDTQWTNKRELETLKKIDFQRKYLLSTNEGEISTKDKNVVFNFEGKVKSRESLPDDLNSFYPLRYYLVASRANIGRADCDIDYIIYVNQTHQDWILQEPFKRKIKKKSIKSACR